MDLEQYMLRCIDLLHILTERERARERERPCSICTKKRQQTPDSFLLLNGIPVFASDVLSPHC